MSFGHEQHPFSEMPAVPNTLLVEVRGFLPQTGEFRLGVDEAMHTDQVNGYAASILDGLCAESVSNARVVRTDWQAAQDVYSDAPYQLVHLAEHYATLAEGQPKRAAMHIQRLGVLARAVHLVAASEYEIECHGAVLAPVDGAYLQADNYTVQAAQQINRIADTQAHVLLSTYLDYIAGRGLHGGAMVLN